MGAMDAGAYSCEMTEKADNEKTREFVAVSVFERESEEFVQVKEKESEEIDFIGPVDVTNSKNVRSDKKSKPKIILHSSVSSSYMDTQVGCERKYLLTLVTCVLSSLL